MKHRRILFVTASDLSHASGQSIDAYAKRLQARGDEVMVLLHGDSGPTVLDAKHGYRTLAAKRQGNFLSRSVKKHIIDFDPQVVHPFGRWTASLQAALEAIVLSNAALVLHVEDDEVFYHRTLESVDSAQSVWDRCDPMDRASWTPPRYEEFLQNVRWSQYWSRGLARPVDPVLFHLGMSQAAAFTAVWEPVYDLLKESLPKRVMILPPGHDSDFSAIDPQRARAELIAQLGLSPTAVLVGHCGSIRHMTPEFLIFLKSFARATSDNPQAHLIVWGRDWDARTTDSNIKALNLESRVHRLGWIDSDQRHLRLLAAMDAHACPGFNNRFNHYRLPSRLCQCFAAGKPVITYRTGFGESLEDGRDALLVDKDDADTWTEKLRPLLSDPDLRDRLARRASELAERFFDTDALTSALQEFYDRVIEEHTSRWIPATARKPSAANAKFLPAFVKARWSALGTQYKRVALYGQGQHTRWMESVLGKDLRQSDLPHTGPDLSVTCLLDDRPNTADVMRPEQADPRSFDAIVLSTDTHQDKMTQRCRAVFGLDLPVVNLYDGFPPGPYDKPLQPEPPTLEHPTEFYPIGPWCPTRTLLPPQDRLEILSVALLDTHRDIVSAFQSLAELLHIGIGWHYLLDLSWTVSLLPVPPGSTLLDAGAGNGLLQYYLARAGYNIISVDRTPVNPNPAWDAFLDASPGSVRRITADLSNLHMLDDQSFDAIVSISALEHNEPGNLRSCVRELLRLLKPGGVLTATLGAAPNEDWYHKSSAGWNYTDNTLRRAFDLAPSVESNYHRYDELHARLRNCAELRTRLADFYYQSADNGMPWGWWAPQYQPVGVCKVKTLS